MNRIATGAFEVSGTFSPTENLVATWLGSQSVSRYPRLWDIGDLAPPLITFKRAWAVIELNWPSGELQSADAVNGSWTTLNEARNPHLDQPV